MKTACAALEVVIATRDYRSSNSFSKTWAHRRLLTVITISIKELTRGRGRACRMRSVAAQKEFTFCSCLLLGAPSEP